MYSEKKARQTTLRIVSAHPETKTTIAACGGPHERYSEMAPQITLCKVSAVEAQFDNPGVYVSSSAKYLRGHHGRMDLVAAEHS